MIDLPSHFDEVPAILRPAPAGHARSKSGVLVPRKAMMPGMFNPMLIAGGKKPIISCVKQATSSYLGATDSITLPAGIQAGDLITIQGSVINGTSGGASFVLPAGYTLIGQNVPGTGSGFACFKIATGVESSTTISNLGANDASHVYMCVVFRASIPLVSATPAGFQDERTNSTPATQTIGCGGGNVPLLAVGFVSYGSGFTMSISDGTWNVAANRYLGWKFYASGATPANISVSTADAGTGNQLSSYYLSLTG